MAAAPVGAAAMAFAPRALSARPMADSSVPEPKVQKYFLAAAERAGLGVSAPSLRIA